jgi:hypothetical protein
MVVRVGHQACRGAIEGECPLLLLLLLHGRDSMNFLALSTTVCNYHAPKLMEMMILSTESAAAEETARPAAASGVSTVYPRQRADFMMLCDAVR